MFPFTGLATREDGAIKLCCKSLPIGDINFQPLEDIWNNGNMTRIRHQVLNNERPSECAACFVYEDQGVESMRQRHNTTMTPETRTSLYPTILDNVRDDYTMPFELPTIEIRLNNLCNLKCRMCSPLDSTSWNDWGTIQEFYEKESSHINQQIIRLNLINKPHVDAFEHNDEWWRSFDKLLPYFKRVEFAGGEPLMDPSHFKILDKLSKYGDRIELKYATNLTMLGKKDRNVFDYWPKFKSVAVNASIDGITDVYEYIRTNAKWTEVTENLQRIKEISTVSRVVASVAVQAANIMSLDKTIELFLNELGVIYWSNFVRYPSLLSCQVLPRELKDIAIARLLVVRAKVHTFSMCMDNELVTSITYNQIDNVIKFLNGDDYSHQWQDFLEFNRRLDLTRNQGPIELIVPEFKPYV